MNVRIYVREEKRIEMCDDCPHCRAFSVDGVAHAWCGKENRELPADGKGGTEIMGMAIPDWCPLPIADQKQASTRS